MSVATTCALCSEDRPLRESHIIPQFVYRWMRETNGTGYFRLAGTPNVRRQDGAKQKMLCQACEQAFCSTENWFATNIFRPYLDERRYTLAYDENLFRFVTSLVWRVLRHEPDALRQERYVAHLPALAEAEAEWRAFLLGGPVPRRFGAMHLFLTDIGTKCGTQPVMNFNQYMARACDFTVAAGRRKCFVYAKFVRFVFFAEISEIEAPASNGTLIAPDGGVLRVPQMLSDGNIGEFMIDRARTSHEMASTMSERQRAVVTRAVAANRQRVLESDDGAAVMADHTALVQPVIGGRVGRNEKCPCGSGLKFKRCHGQ